MASSTNRSTTPVPVGVKRARLTRFRVLALCVMSVLALLVGISVWRMRDLGDLPDVGDPFDVVLTRRPVVIADRDNAYEAYARARCAVSPGGVWEAHRMPEPERTLKWSKAKPEVRAFLEKIARSRSGVKGASVRCLYHQPGELMSIRPASGAGAQLTRPWPRSRDRGSKSRGHGRGMEVVSGDAARAGWWAGMGAGRATHGAAFTSSRPGRSSAGRPTRESIGMLRRARRCADCDY